MAAAKLSDGAFLAILEAHPGLRERFVSIALAVADAEGNLKEADARVRSKVMHSRCGLSRYGWFRSRRPP